MAACGKNSNLSPGMCAMIYLHSKHELVYSQTSENAESGCSAAVSSLL